MKLSVMQENLARGLSVVSRAVSTRSTLPVLANVLLRTEDAGLKLTATNLEIGITYWVPGKIESDGATTVPAKLLTDLVNSLQGGDRVDLELGPGETLHLRCGRFESHLKGIDADEFPAIQTTGERPTTRIAQNILRRALEQTAFAAATDEARPILTGVLCRFEGDSLTLAAADNYRIAVKTIPVLDAVAETSVVVPARALNELMRVLADTDDPVEVVLAQARNQILFHLDGVDLVSRLIDGQFPNYQTVMPKTHTTRAILDREELLRAVRPAALIAHESANIVKLQIGSGRRGRDHGQRERRDRRPRRPGRGRGRRRRHDHRLQRQVPRGRPDQRERGAVRDRAPGAPRPRGLQADRRRPVRPRRDARPHHVLGVATLASIRLADLRGYGTLEATFGPGPQLVWGPNAAGKTSLLEGIVLLAWGHSHRTTTETELVRWGADLARVEGVVGRGHARGRARPARQRDGRGRRPQADPGQRGRHAAPRRSRARCGSSSSPPRRCC